MYNDLIRPTDSKFLHYLKAYLPFWQKKRIGFYGNFGHGDLGDDACFIAARDLLGEDLSPISKKCYAFNPHMLKGFLIGGGGAFRWESPYLPRRIFKKDKWDFPVILFSTGLNCDYHRQFTEETKDKIKKLCRLCTYITVRDRITQKFLNDLGFNNVNILPDLELVLREKPREFNFHKKRFTVGIVLTAHSEFDLSTFKKIEDVFSQFTDYLIDNGKDVVYLPFEDPTSENPREKQLIQSIVKRLNSQDRVRILGEGASPQEVLFAIRNYCDVMVCMRLHSAVFSTNAGIPFLCISYNLMHNGYLEMLDSQDLELEFLKDFSFKALKNKFEYVLNNSNAIKSRIVEKRDYLRSIIYNQISHIKNILSLKAKIGDRND